MSAIHKWKGISNTLAWRKGPSLDLAAVPTGLRIWIRF
jgi:hypothetical protein